MSLLEGDVMVLRDRLAKLTDRVEELESWRAEFLENEWQPLLSDMRGVSDWLAERTGEGDL